MRLPVVREGWPFILGPAVIAGGAWAPLPAGGGTRKRAWRVSPRGRARGGDGRSARGGGGGAHRLRGGRGRQGGGGPAFGDDPLRLAPRFLHPQGPRGPGDPRRSRHR